MPLGIKVDEDLPAEVAGILAGAGLSVCTVAQEGLTGASDDAVWQVVQQERRCLLTADKGFADVRAFPPGTHGGIVLLRLPRESREGYVRLVRSLMESGVMESAGGAIVVVSPDAIRIHRGT